MAKKNDGKKGFKPIFTFNLTWLYIVIAVALGILYFTQSDSSLYKSATYSQFKEYVHAHGKVTAPYEHHFARFVCDNSLVILNF